MKNRLFACFKKTISFILLTILIVPWYSGTAQEPAPTDKPAAYDEEECVSGKVYTFEHEDMYRISNASVYSDSAYSDTYGTFSIAGTSSHLTSDKRKNGVPSYSVSEGHVVIRYSYTDTLLNAPSNEWHLVDDNISMIDTYKTDNNIQKGALILQKSMDHLNWYDITVLTNAFEEIPVRDDILYETTDIEMINGCYYRLIVAFKTAIKTGSSTTLLVIPKEELEFKRTAEIYEFYVENTNEHIEDLAPNARRYSLGETALVSDYASYSGSKEIGKDDLHYGWRLGNFFVSGFTSTSEKNGNVVFLKNVGDVVTLWFNLEQNINALNNNSSLMINTDSDGHDRYFQTPTTNFGRGMLIIRYTDYENIKHEPVMYYDYLLANTLMGTDTRVQLFEEGDYEVALDYEVKKNQLIPQNHHYRIFFKFSVRNANCMVYPFDVVTGTELTNSAVTPNGFYLDLARSRYLKIYIKKEIWTEGADGLTEDTRFNTTAKDGDRYTDEGIYTITVKNQYTGLQTEKKIYVGTNRILLAYMNSDYSIAQIQQFIQQGATVYEDGSIELPDKVTPSVTVTEKTAVSTDLPDGTPEPWVDEIRSSEKAPKDGPNIGLIVAVVLAVVIAVGISYLSIRKKQKHREEKE